MTSRVLGVVRDQVLASIFGAGNAMDAYLVAVRIPYLLRDLFAEGAMSAAFVPTFTHELASRGRPQAWRLGNTVITAIVVITGVIVLGAILFASPLVHLYAPDYTAVPGKIELTITLTRIVVPLLTLIALAAVVMGMLNSLHHYFVPALSPAVFNVALIVAAFTLVPLMRAAGVEPIVGIALGTLVGAIAQILVQWPALRLEGFRYRPLLQWRDPALRRVLLLMGPGTIGLAATQMNLFVNTVLATGQGTGAVSWLNWSFRLMNLPIGLFGVSIATAILPAVSRQSADRDILAVRGTVAQGLSLMMTMNIPATVGLVVLATPIVRLLFERHAFTPADTVATAAALRYYALGLVGYSVVRIVSPTFYALGSSAIPVRASIATVLVNIVLNVALARAMGFAGLALGTSLAALFNATVLLACLRQRLDGLDGRALTRTLARMLLAAALMGLTAAAVHHGLGTLLPGHALIAQLVRVGGAIAAALLVLVVCARILRVGEFEQAMSLITRRPG